MPTQIQIGQVVGQPESQLQEVSSISLILQCLSIQEIHAMSSGEAELYSIGSGISEGLHVRSLLLELHLVRHVHFIIHTDSSAAKSMCANFGTSKKLRHTQLRFSSCNT